MEALDKMEGFEGKFWNIDIPKNMNIELCHCLGKSTRPLLCPNVLDSRIWGSLGVFRGARGLLNTTRTHLDTTGAGLTLPNIEITQHSCFWECQCIRNDLKTFHFVQGHHRTPLLFCLRYFKTIIL